MSFIVFVVLTLVIELLMALCLNPKGYYKAWKLFYESTQGTAVR